MPSSASAAASWIGSSRGTGPSSSPALSATAVSPQEAAPQEAAPQEAVPQEAVPQEAAPQEAAPQEASLRAAVPQLAASKTGVRPPFGSATRNCLSARFGLGGLVTREARSASTSPTPAESGAALGTAFADSISAPLTWSGVQSGCRASRQAAAPATIGAAKEVPESSM